MEKPRAILFEYLDKHRISYDTHYIDDSDVAFDAIEEAMEAYAKYYHEQQVKSVDLADVGGALPSIHVECKREGTMQEHNWLTSMERKGYLFISCETRTESAGRYTYYYFRKQ